MLVLVDSALPGQLPRPGGNRAALFVTDLLAIGRTRPDELQAVLARLPDRAEPCPVFDELARSGVLPEALLHRALA